MIPFYDIPDGLDEESMTPDVCWAAGLFEGEGSLTISGGYPRAKLNSTDEDVVRRFHDIIGVGQVREDRSQEAYGYKRQWEWYTGKKEDVQTVIGLLWHHLGVRRRGRAIELLERFA